MFFGMINPMEYSKIHENNQKPLFGQKSQNCGHFYSDFNKIWVYLCFGTINSLEYSKIHVNEQNHFWAFFGWPKISKFWPMFFLRF